MIKIIIKTGVIISLILTTTSTQAQDLIARQAPVDKKLRTVDSLAYQMQLEIEQSEFPAGELYTTWDNASLRNFDLSNMPETFTIDLSGYCMPTSNTKVTSKFGPRGRRMHEGIDVKVMIGDTIHAAFSGRVRMVRNQGRRTGYGQYVVIRHDNGLETVYGHLSKQLVKEGQIVKAGEAIGLGGNTGRSSGSHLHFETRFMGIPINPAKMFDFPHQDIIADTYVFQKSKAPSDLQLGDGKLYHKVKKGDTLSRIAAKRGVNVNTLCRLNGIKKTTVLRIGQVLRYS